jgi:hypothetical protein
MRLSLKKNSKESDEIENFLEGSHRQHHHVSIRKDLSTIIFITYLYLLQGIVLGLVNVVPLILGKREVGYSEQGTFSFALWPLSIKLLWYAAKNQILTQIIPNIFYFISRLKNQGSSSRFTFPETTRQAEILGGAGLLSHRRVHVHNGACHQQTGQQLSNSI